MSETENQVSVEPASEEKTDTKEVKATKRATEVSIFDGSRNFNGDNKTHTFVCEKKSWLSTKKHNAMPIDCSPQQWLLALLVNLRRFFSFPSPARAHHKNKQFFHKRYHSDDIRDWALYSEENAIGERGLERRRFNGRGKRRRKKNVEISPVTHTLEHIRLV